MRKLKFRAWCADKKTMYEPDFIAGIDGTVWHEIWCEDGVFPDEGKITVMQYTGLKDRNGKEIYEGDVVRWSDYYSPGIIEWDDGSAGFSIVNERMAVLRFEDTEVIGNIYENPDLLTKTPDKET